ncbi:DNA-(apurinic or apyrimidinic site) lyase [Alteromonadaceae bacterium Bs31]|nr:DNA-(apurinic or apyrimidinic site) lyase [Alteromonadaceae bacterium Bs31]
MPELPEVETTRKGIAPHIEGKTIKRLVIRNGRLRWPVPEELPKLAERKTLLSVERRAKYLLLKLPDLTLIWHLGMSGSMRIVKHASTPESHDHIDLIFTDGTSLRYRDPRRFGALLYTKQPIEEHPLLCKLGPEPLSELFNESYLYQNTRGRSQAIKQALMDNKLVVGVGNIYANEALFAAGIHPLKAAGKLSRKTCETLVAEVKTVLDGAIKQGGTTLRDFVGGDGKPGYFAQQLAVYGRGGQACKHCNKILLEKKLGQRSTVYCNHCQK